MLKMKKNAQTSLEYIVLFIIILGAFVGMSNYLKRGIQGRWKAAVDDLGEQYDPRVANTYIYHSFSSVQNTMIVTVNTATGFWTTRIDAANTVDTKTGSSTIGAY